MVDLRKEYPRPQMVRDAWLCLNGEWEFEIDNGENGEGREFYRRPSLDGKILVPYCPESILSGVHNTDYMNCVWYRKEVTVPAEAEGKRVLLHIGAVDYHAKLWINGRYVASHKGGYVPFDADITDFIADGKAVIVVCAYDHLRTSKQPSGKQAHKFSSGGCYYTRTTGIWQSVWLEWVDEAYTKNFKVYPDIASSCVSVQLELSARAQGASLELSAFYEGREMGSAATTVHSNGVTLPLSLKEAHLWDIGKGELYDLKIVLKKDGVLCDEVGAYFGLREVALDKKGMKLNGRRVFGRWVLDQGFYPDGIYTAPSDEALKADIVNSMKLGFNGARLHEKVFEPRFLYWADKLGYPVWG